MAGADEGSRIRDVVRGSKIRLDILRKLDRQLGSFKSELNQGTIEIQNCSEQFQSHGRVLPRSAKGVEDCTYVGRLGRNRSPTAGSDRRRNLREANRHWVRSKVPILTVFVSKENLFNWIDIVDCFFKETQPPENLKCKLAYYALEGEVEQWWQQVQQRRVLRGESKITLWPRMKFLLINDFWPTICSTKCPLRVCNNRLGERCPYDHPTELSFTSTALGNQVKQKSVSSVGPVKCLAKCSNQLNKQEKEVMNIETSTPTKCLMEVPYQLNNNNQKKLSDGDSTDALHYLGSSINDAQQITKCPSAPHDFPKHKSCNKNKEEDTEVGAGNLHFNRHEFDVALTEKSITNGAGLNRQIWVLRKEVFATRHIIQVQQGPPMPIAKLVDAVHMEVLHDLAPSKHEGQYKVRKKYTGNGFSRVMESFPNDNRPLTYLICRECMIATYHIVDIGLLLFDPGGSLSSPNKWGFKNYLLCCLSKLSVLPVSTLISNLQPNRAVNSAKCTQVVRRQAYSAELLSKVEPENQSKAHEFNLSVHKLNEKESSEHSPGTEGVDSKFRFQSICESCDFLDPKWKAWPASMLIGKLAHGKCERVTSIYSTHKLVSFLFDPGGTFYPVRTQSTTLRCEILSKSEFMFGEISHMSFDPGGARSNNPLRERWQSLFAHTDGCVEKYDADLVFVRKLTIGETFSLVFDLGDGIGINKIQHYGDSQAIIRAIENCRSRAGETVALIDQWGRSIGVVTSYGTEDISIDGMIIDSAFSGLVDLMKKLADVCKVWLPRFSTRFAIKYMSRTMLKEARFDIIEVTSIKVVESFLNRVIFMHAINDDFIRPHYPDRIHSAYVGRCFGHEHSLAPLEMECIEMNSGNPYESQVPLVSLDDDNRSELLMRTTSSSSPERRSPCILMVDSTRINVRNGDEYAYDHLIVLKLLVWLCGSPCTFKFEEWMECTTGLGKMKETLELYGVGPHGKMHGVLIHNPCEEVLLFSEPWNEIFHMTYLSSFTIPESHHFSIFAVRCIEHLKLYVALQVLLVVELLESGSWNDTKECMRKQLSGIRHISSVQFLPVWAQTLEIQLEDEFVILGADGDDAARMQK